MKGYGVPTLPPSPPPPQFIKAISCGVCGARVAPKREKTISYRHAPLELPQSIDVMDCPICGCQILLKIRIEEGGAED